ncbi:MAG TPA: patatin-like phospholipase family protein [Streptosporangiaceae bacterium]|jgi:NTE family protein
MGDNATDERIADLVLEGGGVKGIGLAGAVQRLVDDGYTFQRVAGTSAGAITGGLIAAMTQAGAPLDGIAAIAKSIDYSSFLDPGPVGRALGPLKPIALGSHLMFDNGLYSVRRLHAWVSGELARFGVRTWGDLRLPADPGADIPEEHRYRLVVVASDLTRQRAIKLPWDYADYGLDPDSQSVADAVVMSASLPFFFEPHILRDTEGRKSTIVDGGIFTNYPITIFDRTDGKPPRWPTFGVRLCSRADLRKRNEIHGPLSMATALVESLLGAWDAMFVDDPCALARTMFVDTADIASTDFGLTQEQQRTLLDNGTHAADEFLRHWDFADFLRRCRGGAQ